MVRQTLTKEVKALKEQNAIIRNNMSLLKEEIILTSINQSGDGASRLIESHLSTLEYEIAKDNWIRVTGGTSLYELSKHALDTVYDLGRIYWLVNPLIKREVEVQALYTFALGMSVASENTEVDQVIRRFMSDPKNGGSIATHQAWKQNERALKLAGNLFFALFTDETTGRVIVRTLPFHEIMDVIKNPEDRSEPWFYKRSSVVSAINYGAGSQTPKPTTVYHPDWRYNPDEKPETFGGAEILWDVPIYHVKTNCLPDMTYGMSEVYAGTFWAKAYKRYLENWSKLVEAYASFAFHMTAKGGAKQVAAAGSAIRQKFGEFDDLDTTEQELGRPVGSVLTTGEGVTLNAVRTQGATTSADDARRLLLMCCSNSGVPEQITAGDPSTGNLATAKAMERPLELQFRDRQELWKGVFTDICGYVIDQAIMAGELAGAEVTDEYTGETTYALNGMDEKGKPLSRAVSVKFPPILEHDVQAMAYPVVAATGGRIFDLRTAARILLELFEVEDRATLLDTLYPPDAAPVWSTVNVPGLGGPVPPPLGEAAIDTELVKILREIKEGIRE